MDALRTGRTVVRVVGNPLETIAAAKLVARSAKAIDPNVGAHDRKTYLHAG